MGNFIKAVCIGLCVMAALFCFTHQWVGFDISIDEQIIEPVVGLGAVLLACIIAVAVVGLVIAGVIGSVLFFCAVFGVVIGGIVLISGLMVSWPIVIVGLLIWLMVRNKPARNARTRY